MPYQSEVLVTAALDAPERDMGRVVGDGQYFRYDKMLAEVYLCRLTALTHKGGLTKILLQLCLAADDQQVSGLLGIVAKEIVAGFTIVDGTVAGSAGRREHT